MPNAIDKFWSNVIPEPNSGCWIWLGSLNDAGYGRHRCRSLKTHHAHRTAYVLIRGAIPDGMTLDHLCRVRCCVNPDHLDPCTLKENVRRSPIFKGEMIAAGELALCPAGHAFTPENTRIYRNWRHCRACHRARMATFIKRNGKWVKRDTSLA